VVERKPEDGKLIENAIATAPPKHFLLHFQWNLRETLRGLGHQTFFASGQPKAQAHARLTAARLLPG